MSNFFLDTYHASLKKTSNKVVNGMKVHTAPKN